nr:type IX secretion system sortase PorU [Spirosoma utsteinense]
MPYCSNAQSVLQQGIWVKIGVTESGVYRLDQAALTRLDPAFATADPRRIRLYGNGGAPLPQSNAIPRPADLIENAIQVTGEADGRFDAGDALLFFGQSPHVVRYDSVAGRYTHQINPYTDTTFYFVTIGTSVGRRISIRSAGNLTSVPTVTTFDAYQFHEKDSQKLAGVHSGREWLGEYMTLDTTQTVSFDMAGLVANRPIRVTASAMAGAQVPTEFRLQVNGQVAGSLPMQTISGYEYDYQGVNRTDTFSVKPATSESTLRLALTFRNGGQRSAQAYLNFLAVEARRELRQYDQPTWVRRLEPGQVAVRQAAASLRVWDVTDPLAPVEQTYTRSAAQEAAWNSARSGDYFLFADTRLLAPISLMKVGNQDIHSQATPALLIVTPVAWLGQAERLAAFRREHDKLATLIVTTTQVYNEFGSGQPDPTAIRDAIRYFYRKQPNQLRYVLLFGDATFDYRNLSGQLSPAQAANMVPVYESRESLHPVLSYSSDDYYGFMDAAEGEWAETGPDNHLMEIGIGRLPVTSPDEARTVVDKLIRYTSDPSLTGDWQTKVMLVADDGDYNTHQRDAEQLAVSMENRAPAYRPERVYLGAFPQEISSGGQKAPLVNQRINRAVADGRLIINYSGHGGVLSLADEQIVTLADIRSWDNRRLPLFVTATCQFGRYDDPATTSGAELLLLSRTGGAIGLLTTTRPVYANTNLLLNDAFYKAVFAPIDGQMPRLGDVMRLTKNNSVSGPLNRNFALLGDPSMQLAYPKAQVVVTGINGQAVTASRLDTIRGLQTVELAGEIQQQGQRLPDFSGTLRLTLYDKATSQATLGAGADSPKMSYQAYTNTIFAGQVSVQQGRFRIRFTMPKDIDYTVGKAKIYAYALRADSLLDAVGSYDSLRVGGSVPIDSVDNQPPVMALSVVGGTTQGDVIRVTGPDVKLRLNLSDNRGINIARSGLGHELTAQFGDQRPVILNDMYVANGAEGRQGEVIYTFADIAPGTYRVRAKAWDINNNSVEGALSIVVSERPGLTIRSFGTSPNPIRTEGTLMAELDRAGEPLDWTVSIYDLNGRLLNEQTGQCTDCPATLNMGTWDGRANAGQLMPNGLYILRLQVRSAADGSVANGSGRLLLTK